VTLLLGLEVSQCSYFYSWFHCLGWCWRKVSLRSPQWKRTGWASPGRHTRGGPSSSCQSGHGAESPVLLSRLLVHPEKHAAGKARVSPHLCLADLQERREEKQRRLTSEHMRLLLSADQLGTKTCPSVSREDSIRSGGEKSYQPHPLPNIPQTAQIYGALNNPVAIPGGGGLLADQDEKCPRNSRFSLVNPVCGTVILLFCFQAEICDKPTGRVLLQSEENTWQDEHLSLMPFTSNGDTL